MSRPSFRLVGRTDVIKAYLKLSFMRSADLRAREIVDSKDTHYSFILSNSLAGWLRKHPVSQSQAVLILVSYQRTTSGNYAVAVLANKDKCTTTQVSEAWEEYVTKHTNSEGVTK